ncbi:predicted protein [Chaetomium globosum CBS 148.51]|uniref:Uncharacterized protein n=1 Tax=Chaetomium globosum (strain ATCC 6205 / CBS 148.51 / DSM 1962 / NBRC 6347 / NRRL 1970) TaxID=306901 RepID=Q2GRH5_CHAGB|nr:uncharacterized protein CHGG_09429 [Chaetomium globosum CBS 148.51]EAQ85415.1 predicted protein [Chaetomium globosum CBS 148.51]
MQKMTIFALSSHNFLPGASTDRAPSFAGIRPPSSLAARTSTQQPQRQLARMSTRSQSRQGQRTKENDSVTPTESASRG